MKKVKEFELETLDAIFNLTISETKDGSGFVAEYFGTTPKYAQIMEPCGEIPMMKDIGNGVLRDTDIDRLIEQCVIEIQKISGNIIKMIDIVV